MTNPWGDGNKAVLDLTIPLLLDVNIPLLLDINIPLLLDITIPLLLDINISFISYSHSYKFECHIR